MSLSAGTSFGRYRVLSQLGAGGMGEVYLAQDTQLKRKVALKVLPADLITNRERLRRFEQEARAASALNQPNIITIHEIGAEGDTHFIATEFIEGETLRRKLQTTRLEIEETLNIAIQIAAALDAAHRSRIVHRDIKPENVMLREDGLVKVLDFGLAKLTEKKDDTPADTEDPTRVLVKTDPGVVMGTVAYMSPEQARGLEVDARTDIFSLGVCLYEMLAGRLPFVGETTSDVLAAILKTAPAPLDENTPAESQRIVRKSLQKKADERYQTAKDLLIDLKSLKHDLDFTSELERSGMSTRADQSAATQDQSILTRSSAGYIARGIKQHRGSLTVALAVLLLAALGFGYWFYNHPSSNATQIESIAVLPFVNESGNPDVEYLSDGMTESLISSLSQLPNLNVKARSSVFRYKGKEVKPQQVASELSVQALLTGRVAQRGNDLTLHIELVDARTENALWSADFSRQMTNLVALQSEIAHDVANKLRVKLSGADNQRLTKNYTENTEAYQLYLRGRFHWNRRTRTEGAKAIEYFQRAIATDPGYALAYTGLADSYSIFGWYGWLRPSEAYPQARAAATKALELDDKLAEAYASLGLIAANYDWDWASAERNYRRAIGLNPNYVSAHQWYGQYLAMMGRHDESIEQLRRAREIDPLSPVNETFTGQALYFARRYDEAVSQFRRAEELDANFFFTHLLLGWTQLQRRQYDEAIVEIQKARQLNDSPFVVAALGHAYAVAGRREEAMKTLAELTAASARDYVSPYYAALIYAGLRDKDRAFASLKQAYEERAVLLQWLKVDPIFDDLRPEPRFQELLQRVGFTP